jgi:hypothetical protein
MLTVGNVTAVVRMPVGVLPARGGMKVQNRVNSVLGADIDNTIQVFETRLLENHRVHVIFSNMPESDDNNRYQKTMSRTLKVSVIESKADTIQPETLKVFRILLLEEIFQKLNPPSDALSLLRS